MVRWHQTSDVQLHIGESRDSGFDAEPVIGPAIGRTRWHRPGMTGSDSFSIHILAAPKQERRGWPGRSPAMTKNESPPFPLRLRGPSLPPPLWGRVGEGGSRGR